MSTPHPSSEAPAAPLSVHARGRAARRNVLPDAVDYVLAHGRRTHRTGVIFYFLGWRDIPAADQRASWASRLEGTVVVVGTDGVVVTVYRNRHAQRTIARKMKYRLPVKQAHATLCAMRRPAAARSA